MRHLTGSDPHGDARARLCATASEAGKGKLCRYAGYRKAQNSCDPRR
jgi:hypothetical protein